MSRLYKLSTGNKSPLRVQLIRQVDKSDPPGGLDLRKIFQVWNRLYAMSRNKLYGMSQIRILSSTIVMLPYKYA